MTFHNMYCSLGWMLQASEIITDFKDKSYTSAQYANLFGDCNTTIYKCTYVAFTAFEM